MKKKVVSVLLCMALAISFTACNSSPNKSNEETKTSVSEKQQSKEKKSEEFISLDTIKAIPEFKLKDINGKEVTNEIFKNKKYTLVTFWGTW